jgi:hypothetical protein
MTNYAIRFLQNGEADLTEPPIYVKSENTAKELADEISRDLLTRQAFKVATVRPHVAESPLIKQGWICRWSWTKFSCSFGFEVTEVTNKPWLEPEPYALLSLIDLL